VLSSILAAVTDVNNAIGSAENIPPASAAMGIGLDMMSNMVSRLNAGYIWMFVNCLMSAAYVRLPALMISLN
jgi:GDP-mannose transporter